MVTGGISFPVVLLKFPEHSEGSNDGRRKFSNPCKEDPDLKDRA